MEIAAGLLTGVNSLFAAALYCYRQYRWRQLTFRLDKDDARPSTSLAV